MSCIPEAAARPRPSRRGFTLIELLVVIAVIAILASIGIPTWLSMQKKAAVDSTRTLVQAVTTAIASYSQRQWQVSINTGTATAPVYVPRIGRLFDLNGGGINIGMTMAGDGILDGDPNKDTSAYSQDVIDSGYTGFITMTQPPIPKKNVNAKREVVDAWKRPLRIAFGADIYGPGGVAIWSMGPDGKTGATGSPDNKDDITSWESGQHEN